MRAILCGWLTLAMAAALVFAAAPQKKPAAPRKKGVTGKSPVPKAVRRAPRKKTAPGPAPVTAQQRARATEAVTEFVSADVPLLNPAGLVPFFEQLYRQDRAAQRAVSTGEEPGPLRILHYGDSHTAADEWTGTLRLLFQARFGAGGGGYTLAGRPWNSYRRLDVRSYSTSGWHSDGLIGRPGDGLYGLGGVSISTKRPGESIALVADCGQVEVYYLRQPGGGRLRLAEDGETVAEIPTDGETGPGYYRHRTRPGTHRFDLTTVDRAPVRVFGWVTEYDRGITYEPLGINGAQASIVFNWDERLLHEHVSRRNPALIVLAYGTNEAGQPDWSFEGYREMFSALLQRFRAAAPTASLLVAGPPDRMIRNPRNGTWSPLERLDLVVRAQQEAALAHGCAFWDLRARMGGRGSMRAWALAGLAQPDHVHFTTPGYRLLGDLFFQDVMAPYGTFMKVRDELIGRISHGQTSTDY